MQTKSANRWELLRSSYWFIPSLMATGAILLSFALIAVDETFQREIQQTVGLVWAGGPDGARGLLSTVASSMLGVAGVTFSITIATLTLASSQFGPHVIRIFVRDASNQAVLGTFVASYIYSLLILRTVRNGPENEFVPYISVTLAILLALAGIGVLIYFIHHVAWMIQAPHLISIISGDLENTLDEMFPRSVGQSPPESRQPEQDIPPQFAHEAQSVVAETNGYLQAIDHHALIQLAREKDLLLRLKHTPGQFVVHGTALLTVWPADRVDDQLASTVNKAFLLGRQNNLTQDATFAINQMAEIAVRSLSPGINDPYTASVCVDWLGAALCRVVEKDQPSAYRYDDDGHLRMIAPVVSFSELIDIAFNPIRHSALSLTNLEVIVRMLGMIRIIATRIRNDEHYTTLLRHTRLIEQGIQEQLASVADNKEALHSCTDIRNLLEQRQAILSTAVPAVSGDGQNGNQTRRATTDQNRRSGQHAPAAHID